MDRQRFAARGRRFAIATPHEAATAAGLETIEAGGNAVDAALAASVALAVVYPHMCGIGGDLFAVVVDSRSRTVVNGSGAAAAAFGADAARLVHGSMPLHGPLSVSVPGTVAAWYELAQRFGRQPLGRAIRFAAALAVDGLPVAGSVARAIVKHQDRLRSDAGLRALLLPDGRPLAAGATLRQPALASTLGTIAEMGPTAFYDGPVGAALIAGLSQMGSPLTGEDLRQHTTELTTPLAQPYRGCEILVPPPNSQGFVLAALLGCIERARIDADHLATQAPLIARLFQLASSDRDRFLADPRRGRVPVDDLLSLAHADALIERATARAAPRAAEQSVSGDTVGIVAAEDDGPWVSINQSLYDAFGSGILEPETGIICHNRGSQFSLDPSQPNRLEGGKRPAHTLMPVMGLSDGVPAIASATMGSSTHALIHAQLLMALIDQHRDAFDAISRPRWLVGGVWQHSVSEVVAESRVPAEVIKALRAAGIAVEIIDAWDEQVGHAQLIARGTDGWLHAASDPRADGAAEAR